MIYSEKHILIKSMFTNGLNCLKKGTNSIQVEKKPGRLSKIGTLEMVDLINALILADRRGLL